MRHANESGTWNDQELQVYLWQVMGLMWSEVLRRNEERPDVANHLMLDEVWPLLRTPGGAAAIENMARRFRKRRGALWMPCHFVDEPTNRITNDAFDNVTRTAEYKVCAARVTKAAALPEPDVAERPKISPSR